MAEGAVNPLIAALRGNTTPNVTMPGGTRGMSFPWQRNMPAMPTPPPVQPPVQPPVPPPALPPLPPVQPPVEPPAEPPPAPRGQITIEPVVPDQDLWADDPLDSVIPDAPAAPKPPTGEVTVEPLTPDQDLWAEDPGPPIDEPDVNDFLDDLTPGEEPAPGPETQTTVTPLSYEGEDIVVDAPSQDMPLRDYGSDLGTTVLENFDPTAGGTYDPGMDIGSSISGPNDPFSNPYIGLNAGAGSGAMGGGFNAGPNFGSPGASVAMPDSAAMLTQPGESLTLRDQIDLAMQQQPQAPTPEEDIPIEALPVQPMPVQPMPMPEPAPQPPPQVVPQPPPMPVVQQPVEPEPMSVDQELALLQELEPPVLVDKEEEIVVPTKRKRGSRA